MGTFLILVGLFVMGVALTAVIRGNVRWARLRSRGVAGLVLAGAVVVTGVGASLSSAATTPQPVAAPAPTTTVATAVPTTTIVAPPTTTTVAPTTTTTTVKVVAPTHTHAVVHPTTTHTTTHTATHTAPPAPSFTCSASMSNSHPSHNETTDVVVHTGRSGATVDAVAHYKTTVTEHEVHGSGSTVDVPFDISRATYGYPVDVDVTVEVGGVTKSCGTSFTPEAP